MTDPISLLEAFRVLPDPRIERGKEHRLVDLLVIAVCTLLTGGESFYDMAHFARLREGWLRTFLLLPGGPPSHDTFNRLFAVLDPTAFAETFAAWTQSVRAALPPGTREIVALDGKAARRAVNAGEDTRYLVSAWASENGLALGQVQVADKSNFDHGGARPAACPGIERLRGHGRCLALPKEHGQGDQGSRG